MAQWKLMANVYQNSGTNLERPVWCCCLWYTPWWPKMMQGNSSCQLVMIRFFTGYGQERSHNFNWSLNDVEWSILMIRKSQNNGSVITVLKNFLPIDSAIGNVHPWRTNMTMENHHVQIGDISSNACFFQCHVVVFSSVNLPPEVFFNEWKLKNGVTVVVGGGFKDFFLQPY